MSAAIKIRVFQEQLEHLKFQMESCDVEMGYIRKKKILLEKEIVPLEKQLRQLQYEESEKMLESVAVEDFDHIVHDDLYKYSMTTISMIVERKWKCKEYIFYTSTERCTRAILTPPEYREQVIKEIKRESCKYCHSVWHTMTDRVGKIACPKLLEKSCSACHEKGHDKYHCRKEVKDILRRGRKTYYGQ
jgi:hypothetical protein